MDFHFKSKLTAFDRTILGISLVLCPIGLVIALIRVFSTHFYRSCKGRNHRLLGWAFTFSYLFIIALFMTSEAEEFYSNALVYGIILMPPAIVFFSFIGPSDRKFNRLLSQYHWLVMERGITNVQHIAMETGQSPIPAERDLNFMINHRMLPVGVIENGVIRFMPGIVPGQEYANNAAPDYEHTDANGGHQMHELKMVECPGCGARMVVAPNEQKECEYCGNIICA